MSLKSLFIPFIALAILSGAYIALTGDRLPLLPIPAQECTMEARICTDGSAVGRTGPNCEFAACPTHDTSSETQATTGPVIVKAKIGQRTEALGETLVLKEVLEDSRCPRDVQCIWAGTVKVNGTVEGGMGAGQLMFELGKTGTTEVNSFTLIGVEPVALGGAVITESSYIFTFEVSRR